MRQLRCGGNPRQYQSNQWFGSSETAATCRACGKPALKSSPGRGPYTRRIRRAKHRVLHHDKDRISNSVPGRSRTRSLTAARSVKISAVTQTEDDLRLPERT